MAWFTKFYPESADITKGLPGTGKTSQSGVQVARRPHPDRCTQTANRRCVPAQLRFSLGSMPKSAFRMRVSILRCLLCWVMLWIVPVSLLGQNGQIPTGQSQTQPVPNGPTQSGPVQTEQNPTGGAILHTQGGVWINGYEAKDSSAVFPGDLLETKPGSTANLSLDGSTVLIQPESVAKLQTNLLELDHGSVFVGTSKNFKVRVHCMTVVPVSNDWTQYEVNNLNNNVQVAARKNDVRVERELDQRKPTAETEGSSGTILHESEQKSFDESEICGAPPRVTGASNGTNSKWIIGGAAAGTGVLLCVLLCSGGGGKKPLSASSP